MLFRLQDVYWSQEGRLSVNMVTLAAALPRHRRHRGHSPLNVKVSLAAVGGRVPDLPGGLAADPLSCSSAATALKGKYPTALIGLFVGPVAWVGAVRLARPTSPWARRFYSDAERARAEHRTRRVRPPLRPAAAALGRRRRRRAVGAKSPLGAHRVSARSEQFGRHAQVGCERLQTRSPLGVGSPQDRGRVHRGDHDGQAGGR